MFDSGQQNYPKKWKEMSFDFKLMYVYHGCMMVLFIAGHFLSLRQEILFSLLLVMVLVVLSVRHRQMANWRWPGIRGRDLLSALGGLILITVFLYAATPLFPPSKPTALPWYLGGLGIGIFGILNSLKIAYGSEVEFLAQCQATGPEGQEIPRISELREPTVEIVNWKRLVRVAYSTAFFLVWAASISSFYYFEVSFRNGSPQPTATQTEPLVDHGKQVYVTPAEKRRIDVLQATSFIGIPLVLLGGAFLHFIIGVKIFGNAPTLAEYRARKNPPGST